MENKKEIILNFIKTQPLGVLSTVNENGKPEAAVIGISEMDDLTLIFGTFNQYRKYKNLKNNPSVALVIGWEDKTVQYEGTAVELSGEELEEAKKIHRLKSSSFSKFENIPEERYFKITPSWIRFTDYSEEDIYGKTFELSF